MFNLHIQYAAREFFYSSGGQFCTASVHVEKKNNNPYHVGQSGGKRVTSVTGVRTRKKKKVSSCLQENCEHARVVSHKQHWWKWKHWQKKFKSHPAQLCVSSQRISNLQTPTTTTTTTTTTIPSAGVRLWGRGLPNPREELPADAMPAANTVIPGLWTLDYRPFLPVQCIVYSSHKIKKKKKKKKMPSQLTIYHAVHHIHAITPNLGGVDACRRLNLTTEEKWKRDETFFVDFKTFRRMKWWEEAVNMWPKD